MYCTFVITVFIVLVLCIVCIVTTVFIALIILLYCTYCIDVLVISNELNNMLPNIRASFKIYVLKFACGHYVRM